VRLGRDAKVDLIRKAPLFARCSKRELKLVASLADEIDVPEGKELTRQGEPGREFFVILQGNADVRKNGRKINSLGPGDFFGEIALLHRSPRTATVTATSPLRALVVTDRAFRSLIQNAPEIQVKVLQALAERLAPTSL
jgi:CRP-like cAMP-binding protein